MESNICNGTWRDKASSEFMCPLETTKQNPCGKNAEEVPTTFKDYFSSSSEVSWQWEVLIQAMAR